jgi:aryl sulfotransferase
MTQPLPTIEHVYQHHHLDSTRWQHYIPRDDDIIIATPYKSGTTWMQNIVMHLIFQDLQIRPPQGISPWVDSRWTPIDELAEFITAQEHRRFLKTHLPLDGLIFYPRLKYIVVGRDGRDVFMSLWNHYRSYSDVTYSRINDTPERVGVPMPRCPDDIHMFWSDWISKGAFAWENEGCPFWSNFRHVQTWWNFRYLPNILFVHFNDLLNNLQGEIRRIADYLDVSLTNDMLQKIAHAVTFSTMKENAEQIIPETSFTGGANSFLYKGTNGRWVDVLSEAELAMYRATVQRELTPDCAHWLENGRLGK